MTFKSLLVFASLCALPACSVGQSGTTDFDPPDSGYVSSFLANLDRASVGEGEATRARIETLRQARGVSPSRLVNVFEQAQIQRQLFPQLMPGARPASGTPAWTNLGFFKTNHIQNGVTLNVTDSGRMRTILPHPTNPDIVYVLTSEGGLWKATNFTQNKRNWVPLTDGLTTFSGGAAAFGRTPDTIYVGLGDPFGVGVTGGIMIKTVDGGNTFSAPIQLPGASTIRDVKVDASGSQDIVLVATDIGLFRSTDGGASYAQATDTVFLDPFFHFFPNQVWSLAQTTTQSGGGPVTTWIASTQTNIIFGIPEFDLVGALVMSTDHGASWQPISAGSVFDGTFNSNPGPGRTTLAVGKPGDSTLYAFAAINDDISQFDLFRSKDGGLTWTAENITNRAPVNPNPDQPNGDLMGGQAFYNQMLLVDPTDPSRNTVYMGGQLSTAKTTDGGQTFRILTNWLGQFGLPYTHADNHTAAFSNLGKNPTIFFGDDGGLFISDDGGKTWDDSPNQGLITTLHYSVQSTPSHPGSTITGLQDNGTWVRWDDNLIWDQPLGGDGIGVGWSQANDAIALGTIQFNYIFSNDKRSPIKQDKWNFASAGINRQFANFYTNVATPAAEADSRGLNFFTYTDRQIYRTTDGAASWTEIGHTDLCTTSSCVPSPSPGIGKRRHFRDVPHGIGVSPAPDGLNHVAVACYSSWVVVTHDGGNTWHQTFLGLGAGPVTNWQGFNSSAEWADDKTLYIGSESPISGSSHIAKSTDGGLTFVESDNGLPDVAVNRVLVSATDKNTVYAATLLGVYRSTDGGANWSRFGAGLPFVEVRDLYMPPDGSFLRAASYGRGVWQIQP